MCPSAAAVACRHAARPCFFLLAVGHLCPENLCSITGRPPALRRCAALAALRRHRPAHHTPPLPARLPQAEARKQEHLKDVATPRKPRAVNEDAKQVYETCAQLRPCWARSARLPAQPPAPWCSSTAGGGGPPTPCQCCTPLLSRSLRRHDFGAPRPRRPSSGFSGTALGERSGQASHGAFSHSHAGAPWLGGGALRARWF